MPDSRQRIRDALSYLWRCFKAGANPPRAPSFCWYTYLTPNGERRRCDLYRRHAGPCGPFRFWEDEDA